MFRKVFKALFVCLVVVLLVGAVVGAGSGSKSEPVASAPVVSDAPAVAEAHSVTLGERNALASAEDYLRAIGFSRSGLIDQLKFEGFTESEATYAVDNCGADWNEQAVICAKQYMRAGCSLSKQGMIDQLIYEGFNKAQAEYGAACVGY